MNIVKNFRDGLFWKIDPILGFRKIKTLANGIG